MQLFMLYSLPPAASKVNTWNLAVSPMSADLYSVKLSSEDVQPQRTKAKKKSVDRILPLLLQQFRPLQLRERLVQTRISSLLGGILSAGWRPRQESNLYLALRRRSFYPLNYGGGEWILEAGQITAEVVLSERAQVIACTKALQRHFSL